MEENMYQFDLPAQQKSIIKVIGIGGGGSNAVNHMHSLGICDVEFIVCNTDHQALESSLVQKKLQIGTNLTSGLGAGADPEKGKNAAIESNEEIKEILSQDTKMLFITAGMGGGTGTGAAPVIAQIASELDILTVGIVTAPFTFEGDKKRKAAEKGISELKKYCDTVIVIMNDKIREIYGNLSVSNAFAQADNVLTTAAKGIAEIITVPGYVNVDFEDVKTVMKSAGQAVIGSSQTAGENRAKKAVEQALNSPLLNDQNIYGADKILLSIISGEEAELQMDELSEITDHIKEYAGKEAEVIYGHGVDSSLKEDIRVTVIATGFKKLNEDGEYVSKEEVKLYDLDSQQEIEAPKEKINSPNFRIEVEKEEETENWKTEYGYLMNNIEKEVEEEEKNKEIRKAKQIPLEFDFMNQANQEEENINKFEIHGDADDTSDFRKDSKKEKLEIERSEREALFTEHKHKYEMLTDEFKQKLHIPAYERKNVKLQYISHSSEQHISKFNLNEENQIIGNNRFLHDNVD